MDRLEIIETLKHGPNLVEAEVAGLTEDVLRFRPEEGEWSIREVIGHMRDAAEVWYKRLYMVWSQTDPRFVSFDGEAYVKERGYQDADVSKLIAEFREQRLKTVDLLSHAVDWTRIGQQPGVGRRSLKQFAEDQIKHDEDHLAQIRALQASRAAASTR